uniref:Uncharacterized protein n=1 Tax=Rhizophora mucronata TaxID=61149 RepID=A0A2P2IUX8_RHIMU
MLQSLSLSTLEKDASSIFTYL